MGDSFRVLSLNDRVRDKIRGEMKRRKLSGVDLGGILKWTQSRVSQKLTGLTPITLDELEALAFALSLSPVELIRDPGLEFVADLTPVEMRILERYRELPQEIQRLFLHFMDPKGLPIEPRGATKQKPVFAPIRHKRYT